MKIGILVYSETGHTMQVATSLSKRLIENGHETTIEQITANASAQGGLPSLAVAPSVEGYDGLVFAAHVQAFSLAPAMRAYLSQMGPIAGKPAVCLLTQHFKKAWLGGNHALKQMKLAIETKGGVCLNQGIVHWSAKDKDAQIEVVTNILAKTWAV